MLRSRSHLQTFALRLALAGVVLRSLVPVGFMPGWSDAAATDGRPAWLVICPTSPLHGALASPVEAGSAPHEHAGMLATAVAAQDDPEADAGAAMCHGGKAHGPKPVVDAPAIHDASVDAIHDAGHDTGAHGGHRIAAEHLSCPFAVAASPALPLDTLVFKAAIHGSATPDDQANDAPVLAQRRRLPPARAPPRPFDDRVIA